MNSDDASTTAPLEPLVIHRKPKELLKLCFGTYIWTMDSGNLRIEVPQVLTAAEFSEVEELFALVLRGLKRNIDG